jgi:hypothetical protein
MNQVRASVTKFVHILCDVSDFKFAVFRNRIALDGRQVNANDVSGRVLARSLYCPSTLLLGIFF